MRTRGTRKWIAAIAITALLFGFASLAGRVLVVDAPERSEVILVLAGETDRRPVRALELLSQGYGKRLIIDVPAEARIYQWSQVELAHRYVESLEHHERISVCPIEGLSTRDESRDAEKCIKSQGGSRVLLVTSDFHTRRALSVFRKEIPSISFSVAAAHDDVQFGTRWWQHREWAKTCFWEWLRFIWWNAVDRWR